MKKIFLTSGVVLCLACPAFASQIDYNQTGNPQYTLNGAGTLGCVSPDTLTSATNGSTTQFYAMWEPDTYTVTYYPGTAKTAEHSNTVDGEAYSDDATFGENYTVLGNDTTEFSQTGYTFAGWRANNNIVTPTATPLNADFTANGTVFQPAATPLYKVLGGVNMYAQWTPKQYNMTYNSGAHGGTQTGNADPVHNSTVTDTNGLTYDTIYTTWLFGEDENGNIGGANFVEDAGYTFCGWSSNPNAGCSSAIEEGTAMEERWTTDDVGTLYAIYNANTYTLTYTCGNYENAQTGVSTPDATYKTGEGTHLSSSDARKIDKIFASSTTAALVPNDECSLTGYLADSWVCYDTNSTSTTYTYAQVVNANGTWNIAASVTCEPNWTPNTINLTWDAGVGATPSATEGSETCTYDLGIDTIEGAPTLSGYKFIGWTTNSSPASNSGYKVFPSGD